jgi:hypothetical protein
VRVLSTRVTPSLVGGGPGWPAESVSFRNLADEADELRKMVNRFSGDLGLKAFALGIIRDAGAEPRAEKDQALALAEWVQQNIYYVHEKRETFQRPATTLRLRAGDCDDFTLLLCSMLGTVGIREKMCILKINGVPRHIFPVAVVVQDRETHRLTLDATLSLPDHPIRDLENPIALVRARGDRADPLFV